MSKKQQREGEQPKPKVALSDEFDTHSPAFEIFGAVYLQSPVVVS